MLSKSRFVAGTQCHRLLWWKVHDPSAVELQPDRVLQDRFDQGAQVGALARDRFQDGVLIDLPHRAYAERLEATQRAMEGGAPAIFEASFVAHDTFVAVDVLAREAGDSWRLIEVKSASSLKDEHLNDAAVQLYVLGLNGLTVPAVEVMHLNKEFRHPDQSDLLARAEGTGDVEPLLAGIPEEIDAQLAMLEAPTPPDVAVGPHCYEPRDCPFLDRCWPQEPDHIRHLYNVGPKKCHEIG